MVPLKVFCGRMALFLHDKREKKKEKEGEGKSASCSFWNYSGGGRPLPKSEIVLLVSTLVYLPALMSADGNCIFLFFSLFWGGEKQQQLGISRVCGSKCCVCVCARTRACVCVPVRATRQAESEKKWGREESQKDNKVMMKKIEVPHGSRSLVLDKSGVKR